MNRRTGAAVAVACLFVVACTESALVGAWQTVDTPKQTLELKEDHTFSLRLSGKTLGFISDLTGPDQGTWAVKSGALVLTFPSGKAESWPIGEMGEDHLDLSGHRWTRVTPGDSAED